jgi:hypothetical protein
MGSRIGLLSLSGERSCIASIKQLYGRATLQVMLSDPPPAAMPPPLRAALAAMRHFL